MPQKIKAIDLGGVNSYLMQCGDHYVMVDSGLASKRSVLESALHQAGCRPGMLTLNLLTHGDVDHAGNSAYLRNKYGAKIAMHADDAGMVERGDMNWNRKPKPDRVSLMGRGIMLLSGLLLRLNSQGPFETFTPDVYVEDGQELSTYGVMGQILHLPGHSKGSIGVLTTGDAPPSGAGNILICGDLFMNFGRPSLHFTIDDLKAANASLAKLKRLDIDTVYPGHGAAFAWHAIPH